MIKEEALFFLQLFISGLAPGAIYALIALGFVLIYKSSSVLNFAQGDIMMIGAFLCLTVITKLKIPFLPAFFLTLALSFLLGVLVERLFLRPMIGEPILSVVMITIGLSMLITSIAGMIWGHIDYVFPKAIPDKPIILWGSIVISTLHIWTTVIAFIFLAFFSCFFKYLKMGIGMRAAAHDHDVAQLMGISIKKVLALSWAIAAIVASAGGIFLAMMNPLSPSVSYIGLRAFPAVILGGLDSIAGAIIGGLIIGVIENLAGGYLTSYFGGVKEVTAFFVLIVIMMVRPYGLFGTEEIERI